MTTYEGMLNGKGLKFALVVGRFNELISALLSGALDCLKRHDVADGDVDVAWVPGAFEIPLVAKKLAESGRYDAVICLGAVIRGGTPHFDYVAGEVAKGVAKVEPRHRRAGRSSACSPPTPSSRPWSAPAPRPATRAGPRPPRRSRWPTWSRRWPDAEPARKAPGQADLPGPPLPAPWRFRTSGCAARP